MSSPYGLVLGIKDSAGADHDRHRCPERFRFLPELEQRAESSGLRRTLAVESFLLIGVFAATGLLTTSALPHGQEVTGPIENLFIFIDYLWR